MSCSHSLQCLQETGERKLNTSNFLFSLSFFNCATYLYDTLYFNILPSQWITTTEPNHGHPINVELTTYSVSSELYAVSLFCNVICLHRQVLGYNKRRAAPSRHMVQDLWCSTWSPIALSYHLAMTPSHDVPIASYRYFWRIPINTHILYHHYLVCHHHGWGDSTYTASLFIYIIYHVYTITYHSFACNATFNL